MDEAWAEVEAALPENWWFYGGPAQDGYLFRAGLSSAPTEAEMRQSPVLTGSGSTPVLALQSLTAKLRALS